MNLSGRLARRSGFSVLDFGEVETPNWDHHYRNGAREPLTLLYESVSPEGIHTLYDGTRSKLSVQDSTTSQWTDIATGQASGAYRWKASSNEDKIVFTNNFNDPLIHTLGSGTTSTIPDLSDASIELSAARITIQFSGVTLLMNTKEKGTRYSSRVRWSHYKHAEAWKLGDTVDGETSVAGFQDLDYGDEILNSVEIAGQVYIFTASAIWRMFVNVGGDKIFGFTKVYSEPRNRTGCLKYTNTLVSDGRQAYWLSQESIYTYIPYVTAVPLTTGEHDWLLKASGRVFEADSDKLIDSRCCESPVGEYNPETKEVWFFYPRYDAERDMNVDFVDCINDYGIVLKPDHKTADYVDFGATIVANFTHTGSGMVNYCNTGARFLIAASKDYSIKDVGTVFERQYAVMVDADPENDIPNGAATIEAEGYYSHVMGLLPLGYPQREKTVRSLVLEHDTKANGTINFVHLRLGLSHHLADPLSADASCGVLWHEILGQDDNDLPLACPDEATLAKMLADGQKQSDDTGWECHETARHIYLDMKVIAEDGSEPKGSDSAWASITADSMVE